MTTATLHATKLTGTVAAVPSKSYAHRLLIAAALSGESLDYGTSDDARRTARGLVALGFQGTFKGETVSYGAFRPSSDEHIVEVGESGSTLRFLLPLAAALGVRARFVTEGRLGERPMDALTAALRAHGVECDGKSVAGKLTHGVFEIDATVSSQFITGLMMTLPLLEGESELRLQGSMVSAPYVEITKDVLKKAGIVVRATDTGFCIPGGQKYTLKGGTVPGDFSGAAFYLVAGALGEGVTVTGLDMTSAQGDKRVVDVLRAAGAEILEKEEGIYVKRGAGRAFTVDVSDIPDLAPILSVFAAFCEGNSLFTGVKRLRDKESDRLAAIVDMLTRAGICTNVTTDALTVTGGTPHGGAFQSYADHRMCMSSAVLAAFATGKSTVTEWECVKKSYPNFWEDFEKVGGKYEVEG